METNMEKALRIFRSMKRDTKTRQVLQYLIDHGGISSLVAFEKFRATRLSAIIFCLRHNYGLEIDSEERTTKDGTHYAEYRLI